MFSWLKPFLEGKNSRKKQYIILSPCGDTEETSVVNCGPQSNCCRHQDGMSGGGIHFIAVHIKLPQGDSPSHGRFQNEQAQVAERSFG
mmetsp:Transcript_15609/g.43080  ORF Transcript_15609/g.43080 Transcript_15609/m.43080 type:complete len:88 (-) Transcript_15609:883-1146(-)